MLNIALNMFTVNNKAMCFSIRVTWFQLDRGGNDMFKVLCKNNRLNWTECFVAGFSICVWNLTGRKGCPSWWLSSCFHYFVPKFLVWIESNIPRRHRTQINVHNIQTSSERLMYVQFTSSVYGDAYCGVNCRSLFRTLLNS